MKLHRIHAAPAQNGGQSFDVGPVRWRGEGKDLQLKRDQARRAVVCWNVCEGLPTEALEAGALRDFCAAARSLAVAAGGIPELAELAAAVLRHDDQVAAELDTTHGRLHDCEACGAEPVEDGPEEEPAARRPAEQLRLGVG